MNRLTSFWVLLLVAFCVGGCHPAKDEQKSSDTATPTAAPKAEESALTSQLGWTYLEIDNQKDMWGDYAQPEWLRYFGLAAGDINADGLNDIVSGRSVYLQQESLSGIQNAKWKKLDLGDNVDAILILDIDGDEYLDIIAQSLPSLYWYELDNEQNPDSGKVFSKTLIGEVPATTHVNSQGFTTANVSTENDKTEFLIAGNGNIYVFSALQDKQGDVQWQKQRIAQNTSDEGIGVGDIDGDGDLDIAAGRRPDGEPEPTLLFWYENPGHINSSWASYQVGDSTHPIDRVEIADLNGNGLGEIIFTEERYPGKEPDAQLVVLSQSAQGEWDKHVLATQYSMNNLDVGDIDLDGDLDLITAEHKGDALETQIWRNDGHEKGTLDFTPLLVDAGKESHLGTQFVDIDKDGDLDIISAGWDKHQFVHLWLNPLKQAISISEIEYLDRAHFKIDTPSGTYLLDKKGGGLSSMIDLQGQDWIKFKTRPWGDYPAAAAGGFRGLPNAVHGDTPDSGAGHPGFDKMNTIQSGANQFTSTSLSGAWAWTWTIHPTQLRLDITASPDDQAFWFLYEGTPGGRFDLTNTRYGTSETGLHADQPDFYKGTGKEGDFAWAYFSHMDSAQSLYVMHLDDTNDPDFVAYLGDTDKGVKSNDGMVVFGFGRNMQGKPQLMGKHSFVVGFAPMSISSDDEHDQMEDYLNRQVLLSPEPISSLSQYDTHTIVASATRSQNSQESKNES